MNIIDFVILALIAVYIFSGIYKGFVWNASVIAASVLSCILALLFMGPLSSAAEKNETLFDSMLSYTEGAEAIYDVEYAKKDIAELSTAEIDDIMQRSNLPYPMGERIYDNIMNEEFKDEGITTLGDYFNQSMVRIMLNIVSFVLIYIALRIFLTFMICWADYAFKFPKLHKADALIGGGVGVLRSLIGISAICMLIPIALVILPFDNIKELFESSKLVSFFYKANPLLKLIPGV